MIELVALERLKYRFVLCTYLHVCSVLVLHEQTRILAATRLVWTPVILNSSKTSRPLSNCRALNPLTTDDGIWRRLILATCYQLAQSVLKIGLALAEKVG